MMRDRKPELLRHSKLNWRRITKGASRALLEAVDMGAALAAAGIVGLWITHHPGEFQALSGDTFTLFAFGVAALAAFAADALLGDLLIRPLWSRVEDRLDGSPKLDDGLKNQILAHLAEQDSHFWDLQQVVGIGFDDLFAALERLLDTGEITVYWTEQSPKVHMYSLAPQA